MQFTTISDTHGLHHQLKLPGGVLLIHTGDVCNISTQEEAANFIDWFEKQPYAYKVFIAGNHDFFFEHFTQQEIQKILPKNIFYLNDSGIEIEGIKLWGSPITPEFIIGHSIENAVKKLKNIGSKFLFKQIFSSHTVQLLVF